MDQLFGETTLQDLELAPTLLNLVVVLVLGQVLSIHYRIFAKVLSNKSKFAPMLVFIAAATMLVISVVKTSFALSLGLVGALSIIRFRTPVKEPEELAYLFLAVGAGVGIGADQRVATSLMLAGILLYVAVMRRAGLQTDSAQTLLHVSGDLNGMNRQTALDQLTAKVLEHAAEVDLRRVDVSGESFDSTLSVNLAGAQGVGPILDAIETAFPGSTVSIVEATALD